MKSLETYLVNVRNKVFKLLPMRERHENGEGNHLKDYLEYILVCFDGGIKGFPELSNYAKFIEAQSNIFYLFNHFEIGYKQWRSIVFRSTRLIQETAEACTKGGSYDD